MVEVFKTNIPEESISKDISKFLLKYFPKSKISFDLQDCDKILRIEAQKIEADTIISLVSNQGFMCEILT